MGAIPQSGKYTCPGDTMQKDAVRAALEMLIGKKEATLALAGAAARPTEVSGTVLRAQEAGWI